MSTIILTEIRNISDNLAVLVVDGVIIDIAWQVLFRFTAELNDLEENINKTQIDPWSVRIRPVYLVLERILCPKMIYI